MMLCLDNASGIFEAMIAIMRLIDNGYKLFCIYCL